MATNAEEKAQKLSKVKLPKTFSHNGIDVTVLVDPYYTRGLLGVWVRAQKDGKELYVNNPLLYHNPPMKHFLGDELKEDHEEVIKTIIVQTICTVNKIPY